VRTFREFVSSVAQGVHVRRFLSHPPTGAKEHIRDGLPRPLAGGRLPAAPPGVYPADAPRPDLRTPWLEVRSLSLTCIKASLICTRTRDSYRSKVLCLTVSRKESVSRRSRYSPTFKFSASKTSPWSASARAVRSFLRASSLVFPET
jgi:hypothetical protein